MQRAWLTSDSNGIDLTCLLRWNGAETSRRSSHSGGPRLSRRAHVRSPRSATSSSAWLGLSFTSEYPTRHSSSEQQEISRAFTLGRIIAALASDAAWCSFFWTKVRGAALRDSLSSQMTAPLGFTSVKGSPATHFSWTESVPGAPDNELTWIASAPSDAPVEDLQPFAWDQTKRLSEGLQSSRTRGRC